MAGAPADPSKSKVYQMRQVDGAILAFDQAA
jgi:hypothetical protein